jgi:hypothetical protein
MIDMTEIRHASWREVVAVGLPINKSLPLLDVVEILRSKDDVVNRIFAMNCVAATAYGFDRSMALGWLRREDVVVALTPSELSYLNSSRGAERRFFDQIEGLWALCWCIGSVRELDFLNPCANDFVKSLPDLKKDQAGAAFRERANLRSAEEVLAKCDLAYCLNWSVVHLRLSGARIRKLNPVTVIERRRALEWVISDEIWDEVHMDT